MPDRTHVFLFDIDGVLVSPHGYRAAVRATLAHFAGLFGLPSALLPSEETYAIFEAQRITSEWDMVPLCLAALLDACLALNPGVQLPAEYPRVSNPIFPQVPITVDYQGLASKLGSFLPPGLYPAEAAYQALTTTNQDGAGTTGHRMLPALRHQPLLSRLLLHTRDVRRSPTTRIFQHYTLGSQTFNLVYGLNTEFETPSLLLTADRPQLPASLTSQLLDLWKRSRIQLAAYTLRPSLPPRGLRVDAQGYPPEAEMALQLCELEAIPLIGYGRMLWLAEKSQSEAEQLIKPNPVQALAAIFAALNQREDQALEHALALVVGTKRPLLPVMAAKGRQALTIHIFEDSAGGIEAVSRAAQLLEMLGLVTEIHTYGINDHPQKTAALNQAGAQIYASSAQAVLAALNRVANVRQAR